MTRILIVEDERDLALGIRANLEVDGYEVTVVGTGEEALPAAESGPDLVVLDLMLPGISGYDVLAAMRTAGNNVPVLILSARAEEVDKVRGFRTGADDYLTKPFGVMELIVRIEALLRRSRPRDSAPAATDCEQLGDVLVDSGRRIVLRAGQEVPLTPKEFDLLRALLRKRDRVVTRQELLRDVWGYAADVSSRTVDVHVAELRRKIERDPSRPRHIVTIWRTGYRLRP